MEKAREKLYEYSVEPPNMVWEAIRKELNREIKVVSMQSRPRILKYFLAAAAALVILFFGKIFFNQNNSGIQKGNEPSVVNVFGSEVSDSLKSNKRALELIVEGKTLPNELTTKKYMVISGPQGEPVKISGKAAQLILSIDGEYPPRPVWDKKIEEWKQIMLSSTFTSSPAELMDVLQQNDAN